MSSTPPTTPGDVLAGPLSDPVERRKEQRSWYFYDWANSAYVTTTATVLFGPYLTVVAKRAACPGQDSDLACPTALNVLGVPVGARLVGALRDHLLDAAVRRAAAGRRGRGRPVRTAAHAARPVRLGRVPRRLQPWCWSAGTNWQLGVLLLIVANLALGCSLVVYDAILVDIATPDERDGSPAAAGRWATSAAACCWRSTWCMVSAPGHAGAVQGGAVRLSAC